MASIFGIVNSSSTRAHVDGLEDYRPIGAFSFLGRYRIIDFAVSNMSNSNIDRIQVYVSQNPRSLAEHLSYGQHYNINAKKGKLQLLFNQDSRVNSVYNTDIRAYYENIDIIERMHQDYVVITSGNWIFKEDFRALVDQHIESGADVTLLYTRTDHGKTGYRSCMALELNRQKGVTSIVKNDASKDGRNIFMDTYVMGKDTFVKLIRDAVSKSSIYDLIDILNVDNESLDIRGVQHKGMTAACVYDIRSYFWSNMELLDYKLADNLITPDWPIYTQTTDSCPVRYYKGASVKNSMIANGAEIRGKVENSIIGRGVVIEEGAFVENSIVLGHAVIGKGVHLDYQIVDKWAQVLHVKELKGDAQYPGYVRRADIL